MMRLLRFPASVKRDPSIDAWMTENDGVLDRIARHWFQAMVTAATMLESFYMTANQRRALQTLHLPM